MGTKIVRDATNKKLIMKEKYLLNFINDDPKLLVKFELQEECI